MLIILNLAVSFVLDAFLEVYTEKKKAQREAKTTSKTAAGRSGSVQFDVAKLVSESEGDGKGKGGVVSGEGSRGSTTYQAVDEWGDDESRRLMADIRSRSGSALC